MSKSKTFFKINNFKTLLFYIENLLIILLKKKKIKSNFKILIQPSF